MCKQARAIENCAYLVSANAAGFLGEQGPPYNVQGHSMIVAPTGQKLAQAGVGDIDMTYAMVDIASVQHMRATPGMANLLSRQRFELYADSYARLGTWAPDQLAKPDPARPMRAQLEAVQAAAIARLKQR